MVSVPSQTSHFKPTPPIRKVQRQQTWKECTAHLTTVKVMLKGYWIQRALASAHMLCPFPEYCPVFQKGIHIVSEDPDDYCSVSEGRD
jgi:hypothetical protein